MSPAALAWGLAAGMAAAAVGGWEPALPGRALAAAAAVAVVAGAWGSAARGAAGLPGSRVGEVPPAPWPPPGGARPGRVYWPGGGPKGRARRRAMMATAAAVLAGAWLEAWRLARQEQALQAYEPGVVAWVGGWVVEPPVRAPFATYLLLRGARLSRSAAGDLPEAAAWVRLPADVEVAVPAGVRETLVWRPGMWVAARGLVRRPHEAPYPGGFSLRRYLRARGAGLVVEVQDGSRLRLAPQVSRPGPVLRVRARLAEAGRALEARLSHRLAPSGASWARAVVLGRRDALAPAEQEALWASGLGHLLSVSGVHVGLLAGPLVAAARSLAGSRAGVRAAAAAAACAAGWAYAGMTGMGAPAVRAGLVQSLGMGLWALGRRISLVGALGIAAALQMALSGPGLGADMGFQMSYLATLGIALFVSTWDRRGGAPGRSRRGGLRAALGGPARRAAQALGLSFAAWAAVTPLTALYFGRVSLTGVVASAAAGPLCGVLMWSALAAALLPEPLAWPAARVEEAAAAGLRWVATAAAGLEGGGGRGLSAALGALPAALGLAALGWQAGARGRARRGAAAWAAAPLAAWLVVAGRPGAAPGPAALVAAPVGRGAWVVAGRSPAGEGWLVVEAGAGEEREAALEKARAVLAGLGVARARVAVLVSADPGGAGPLEPEGSQQALSRVWIRMGPEGPTLAGAGGPVGEVRAGSLRLMGESPVASAGAAGVAGVSLRVEMAGAGAVRLRPGASCLSWDLPGLQHCRSQGSLYLTER